MKKVKSRETYVKVKREVIKVTDRASQTDDITPSPKPTEEFLEMKSKYESSQQELKKMKLLLKRNYHCVEFRLVFFHLTTAAQTNMH